MQIIPKGPRERFATDLINVTSDIDDKKKLCNFILNIIDHYWKLVGSYLLVNKTALSVLNCINNFISIYGVPNILQSDNGLEYKHHFLKDYCNNKNINLIYSGIKHLTINGVEEIVHQDIVNSLLAQKLQLKNKYHISFCLSNAVYAHINNIHESTKLSPKYLFNNYENIPESEIENKMIIQKKN